MTFNGRDMTLECLRSVAAAARGLNPEIVVVDNGSVDGTPEAVEAGVSGARVLRMGENLGYGPAANRAMRASSGRHMALVNNDAILPEDSLTRLAEFLDANRNVAVVGPQLVRPDGRRQHAFDVEPSLATELLNKGLLRRLFPRRYPSRLQERAEPFEVASLVGACFVVRRAAAEELGYFDEEFFYLYEETDFCRRARQAGWRVMLHPGIRVVHFQGQTRRQVRIRAKVEQARSRFAYFRKHHPVQHVLLRILYPVRSLLETWVWFWAAALTLGLWPRARARLAESAAVLLWLALMCPRGLGLSRVAPGDRKAIPHGS